MTEGGCCLPLTPSAAFSTSCKPSKTIRKNGAAWGVQIVHHLVLSFSFSRELLRTIMTLTMLSEARSDSALHSAIVKEGRFVVGQLDHFEELPMTCRCSLAARYPAVSLGLVIAAADTSVFGGLLRRLTEQGFDVYRQGTHSSSPQPPLSDMKVRLETVWGKQQLNSTVWCQEYRGEHNYLGTRFACCYQILHHFDLGD